MPLLKRFKRKVAVGLPSPCRMLVSVVDRNKKGQIQLRVLIKVPASVFSKTYSPIRRPDSRKNSVLIRPRIIQDSMVFLIARKMSVWSCLAFASEIAGSSMTATELVRTFGNRIMGNAIPVRMPNTLKASDCV